MYPVLYVHPVEGYRYIVLNDKSAAEGFVTECEQLNCWAEIADTDNVCDNITAMKIINTIKYGTEGIQ